ncbi:MULTISPECIES: Hpt domain-containing protein [unclassified Wenzhouxiangella]|uniref:hybrid sensor histidine kinase/response regulator n=1 Tax=unclassified Wenzhouxiangella TaxID=2613841 RepID=UPI000E32C467|nr:MULTISPECIES: Hpt domain-containing protein [unclassified Wenzhouxiangella]RFF28358.1 hybrid sensor histidine kinase/response regulator [Wenzhouxiangella sp. 15181]RFP69875.1 hybrid sensor histidine kinase/response regulator [Wenzhouxiangella sp. 15190]
MSSSSTNQSLQWTRPLIDELGQEILQSIEQWSEAGTDRDPADLDSAIEASRRIAGSLSVLEFESGDLLGDAMVEVLEALRKDDFGREEEALNALMEATAVLPDYLDYLESTQRDAPLVLLPTINNLRAVVGATPLDESEFFRPQLEHVVLPEGGETPPTAGLRRSFQQALGKFLVNNDDEDALAELTRIGLAMRDNPDLPASARRTGWAAAAVSASLQAGELESNPTMARLYARLDALLKTLADGGTDIDETADDLCRSFLFNLVMHRPANDLAVQAYDAFRLDEYAPDATGQSRAFLAGKNRGLFAAVTQAAREDLAQIKDTLGTQLEGSADPDLLEKQTELLGSVGESLAMLGLDNLARRIHAQADRLADLGSDPEDPALLSVARELLIVESQLEENQDVIEAEAGGEDEEDTGTLLPPSEWRRVLRQVFHEAGEDLSHAKSLLDAVNRGKAEPDAAGEAHEMLDRIGHVLYMAELEDGAAMLVAATHLIDDQLIDSDQPSEERLETLAEALTVSEFYFDAQTRLDEKGRQYFANTRQKLEELGYWPGSAEVEAGPTAEPGAEAEFEAPLDEEAAAEQAATEETEATEALAGDTEEELEFETDFEMDEEPGAQPEETAEEATESPDGETRESIEAETGETAETPPEDALATMGGMDDFDIVEIFLEEFDQELETLQATLPEWREEPDNNDVLTTIRRSFHSLKGSGRMAGADEIGEFSWQIENLMNRVIEGQVSPEPGVMELVESAVRMLPSMRARLSGQGEQEYDEAACAELAQNVEQVASGEVSPAAAATVAENAELEGLDPTMIELMVKELSENLETLDQWVDRTQEADMPRPIDDQLVRAVHTMKGTMRLAPIGNEKDTAQILEQYLEELAHSGEAPDEAGLKVILECQELFHKRLGRLQGESVEDEEFETGELSSELRRLHGLAYRDRTEVEPFSPAAGFSEEGAPEPAEETAEETTEPSTDEEPVFSSDSEEPGDESDEDDIFGLDEVASEAIDEAAEALADEDAEADEELAPEASEGAERESDTEPEAEIEDETEFEETASTDVVPEEAAAEEAGPEAEASAPEAEPETTESEAEFEAEAEPEPEIETEPEPEPEPEQAAEELYADLDEDLLEAFLEEAGEVLEHADDALQQWRESPEDKALVTSLQRDLHTIKGSSRMVGLDAIGSVAHVMEELLEGIAAGIHRTTPERIDALEAGCDHLHGMVEAVEKREPMPERPSGGLFPEQVEELEETEILPELAEEDQAATEEAEETQVARTETLRVPANLVDDLVNFAGEISIFRSRLEEQVNVFRNNVAEVDETVIRLRDQLRKLEIETEAQILARYEREHGPADEAFDPLELDRYSTIQQLSRALGESVNDLTSLTSILDDATRQSETLLMQQSRVNTELQEGLMQARMVGFNTLLPRFRRVVRNAARDLEKQAHLEVDIEGDGQLDRSVLDRITAPLEHLLRNSVSHGIESPEQRRQAGKPETGSIHIDVSREATELVLRVSDDGAGLNLDAIRQRGIDQNLLDDPDGANDRELAQLIFRPGFSTADQVSELAGRGIGMDVVANEVRQIGGSVRADSEAGKGALFTIRIPLSLTVMQAIMVRVSDRQFAIPLQAVRGVTRMLGSEWERQVHSSDPHQEYAGEEYPLLELETQLGFDVEEHPEGTLSLLMIESGEHRAALRVSELQGHREIVIKPVGPQVSSITGILGGTITGDGQVVPILDMGPLIRRAFDKNLLPGHEAEYERAERAEEIKRTPLVMVVDDSITMRRVTARVLEHRGLEVVTARDGLDAVESMFERVPDLILLDIEMPRMDGYELATHVRNDPRLKDVPMVMITSRSGEKHRQHAKQLGVDGYLTKPYQEGDLIEEVFGRLRMPVPQG